MSISQTLVPHILSAITSTADQQEKLSNIIKFVDLRLKAEGIQIKNLKNEVEKGLQIGTDFGLLAAHNNVFRLKFNPQSKPPFGVQLADSKRSNSGMNVQNDEEDYSEEDDDDLEPKGSNAVVARRVTVPNKSSDTELWPITTQVKRKRRRSRSRRTRSRSRRRRRH